MDSPGRTAPPVVAVVVTRDPGAEFDEVLDGLAEQDYPNLRVLVLDTAGGDPDFPARVGAHLPEAFIRRAVAHPTYGGAANEALKLVEGAGFFCFLHDDVALEPTAIRLLVEETYRSNGGVVGPKVVDWDDPARLLSAGVGADKFGEPAPAVDPGELDQEQHDGVRDTFSLSTACLLVRTDLFRAVGGFDAEVAGRGDELDLCWRAHASGARVLVVPAARARWRGGAGPADERTRERNRLRTVLASYSGWHLVRVLPQYALVTVIEVLASLVTGHVRRAGALLAAWPGALGERREIRRKRRVLSVFRQVGDNEVRRLQARGSARLAAFFGGHRRHEEGSPITQSVRDAVDMLRTGRNRATYLIWVAVVAVFVVGSRTLIRERVPALGGFLAFPGHATTLLGDYLSGWWAHGLGAATAIPSGVALVGLGGLGFLGSMSLFRTVAILGPILLGFIGLWRLVRPLGTQRARLTGLLVYAACALPYNAVAAGHWSSILVYGAMPWAVATMVSVAGLPPFAPTARPPVARVAALGLLIAVVSAFVPAFAIEVVMVAAVVTLASALLGGFEGALRGLAATVVAALVAFVLHLPWLASRLGELGALVGSPPLASPDDRGLDALLRFATGPHDAGALAYLLLVPAAVALLLGRGWRLAWAGRAVLVAVAFFALAWSADRGVGPADAVPVDVWLVPAAVGIALAGACGATAFDTDVRGTRFSWRQPLGFLAVVAVGIGVLPTVGAAADGSWGLGHTDMADALAFLPSGQQPGDYRILWIGDPRALPQPGWELTAGVAYALSSNGAPDVRDAWAGDPTRSEGLVADALGLATSGESARLGRMLGPMSVRYIVVPLQAGPQASGAPAYPPPSALLNTLAGQLDLRQKDIDDALVVYENEAWIPERATLPAAVAAASDQAGFESLVRTDLAGSTAVLPDGDGANRWTGDVGSGTLYLSAPADSGWELRVDGATMVRRPAFGWANAFAVDRAGSATLGFDTPLTRPLIVAVQALLWLVVIGLALRRGRRRDRDGRERHPATHRVEDPPVIIELTGAELPGDAAVSQFVRRAVLVVAIVVFAVVGVTISRDRPTPVAAAYGTNDQPPMPIARTGDALTTSWFCPGLPAMVDRSTGDGSITVLNPTDTPMTGNLTFFPGEAAAVTTPLRVAARGQAVVVPRDLAPAPFTGVLVEVYGTNAVVAQTTVTKEGWSSSPCSTTASGSWYVAEGTTTIDSAYQLLVLNPFPDDAIVDVSFAADDGFRAPTPLQGWVVKARSLRIVDVDAAVQRDQLVSASVVARNGRVVVGRFQTLPYSPRKGLVATLAEPSAGAQWWFANGQKGDGVAERVILYNPLDTDSSADVTVFPADPATGAPVPLKYTVPSKQRVEVDLSGNEEVPAGPHSIAVATDPDRPIVAERVLDLVGKDRTATTVQAGSRMPASRWYLPLPAPGGGTNVVTVVNVTGVDTSVGVSTLGAAGETPVPDLQNLQLPAGGSAQIPLQDHGVAGQPVVVTADGQVVVEQFVVPPPGSPGASSTLGVPVR